jgi:asparaginyl-tRNA synthetase
VEVDCEGAGDMFRVSASSSVPEQSGSAVADADADAKEFFGKPTFLTVSGQVSSCFIVGFL